jgi:SAM-dependent methyltransferase
VSADYFDERVARQYRERWPHLFERGLVEATVEFLVGLVTGGTALEFGVGTGRIALPLQGRGVRVHGIDLSSAMLAELRAAPSGSELAVTLGDFSETKVDGSFGLVYLLRNTIMNLTTQDAQVECFRNAADHLQSGGCFVIEVVVPDLRRLPPGETFRAFDVTMGHLGFDEYDVATQIAWSHHYWVVDGHLETFSAPFRYVWPAELDLMAALAGLRLRERWSGWAREPFTAESRSHVSVWEKPAS